ncbi:nucleotide pyrophosphohydrolase [Antribacter gilvus]|uniref:nucleotide pyrophosphohydrolase n=1 Tax=Antribacter gilvus TaxID=2304675 RepID=UPI000F77349A|nr:nucleotide pyrophosphohydrolase [Antribacter gilvus]
MTDLSAPTERAVAVADAYDRLNLVHRGRTWTTEELMLGFVGDVGDLSKLVMADVGARDIPGHRELLGHELADCLWAVLVIAARSGVDLGTEFDRCMDLLDGGIARSLEAAGA